MGESNAEKGCEKKDIQNSSNREAAHRDLGNNDFVGKKGQGARQKGSKGKWPSPNAGTAGPLTRAIEKKKCWFPDRKGENNGFDLKVQGGSVWVITGVSRILRGQQGRPWKR